MIQKNIHKKLNNKGFTLIELIVVIAVLSILAAIAIPRLSGFKVSAANGVDEANVKILTDTAHRIEAETGSFPTEADWGSSFTNFPASKTPYLDKDIEIQNPDNIFEYDEDTGIVSVNALDVITPPVETPPSGGSALQNTINAKTLIVSNPTSFNPEITVPSDNGIIYVFSGSSSRGGARITIGGNGTTATIARQPSKTWILTLTLKATQVSDGETVTRIFNVTVPGYSKKDDVYDPVTVQ